MGAGIRQALDREERQHSSVKECIPIQVMWDTDSTPPNVTHCLTHEAEDTIYGKGGWVGNIHQHPKCAPTSLTSMSENHPMWTITSVGQEEATGCCLQPWGWGRLGFILTVVCKNPPAPSSNDYKDSVWAKGQGEHRVGC